ncbi:MAG: TonB C-terminal domain-containing protein [Proteobacteria bacterium]|nr:TonB C-terminal domain-containing protein [Pseudomonadota bacterium]
MIYLRQAQAEPAGPQPAYVVARLVRLGKATRPPPAAPASGRAAPPTRPPEAPSYDAEATDAPRTTPPKPEPDREAVVGDRLRQALEKAALLDEGAQQIAAEGQADGVAGGTATEASAGDAYITRIADLWLRTWSLPAIIPAEEAMRLYALVVVRIDATGAIQFPIAFDRPSGNDHFDGSIRAAWQRIGQLPVPPPDRLAAVLANGLRSS